jgi:hypothetical protein
MAPNPRVMRFTPLTGTSNESLDALVSLRSVRNNVSAKMPSPLFIVSRWSKLSQDCSTIVPIKFAKKNGSKDGYPLASLCLRCALVLLLFFLCTAFVLLLLCPCRAFPIQMGAFHVGFLLIRPEGFNSRLLKIHTCTCILYQAAPCHWA